MLTLCRVLENEEKIKQQFSWKKIILPVLIGLSVSVYLLIHDLGKVTYQELPLGETGSYSWVDTNGNAKVDLSDPSEFIPSENGRYEAKKASKVLSEHAWTWSAVFALLAAFLMLVLRDFFYMYRIRVLSGGHLSWRSSFDVIMLWEFASALTPSVVGGSGVAVFILNREGINVGKSTATVMVTALMDELFFIIMVPILFLLVGTETLFPETEVFSAFGANSIKGVFWAGYVLIVVLTSMILLSIISYPHQTKRLLVGIFRFRLLRRWQKKMVQWGDEMIVSSVELKGKPFSYWGKAFGATIVSWTARYFTLNFIFMAFVGGFDHLQVYGRQLVMWVIMLISPTPGSSGVAELAFSVFFDYLIPGGLLAIATVLWRLLTYFPYLLVGTIVLPGWLRRTAKRKVKVS